MNAYGSFLYWNVNQDGMESAVRAPAQAGGGVGTLTKVGAECHPGFQVGIGMNLDYDDWTSFLEYTWMHQNTNNSSRADPLGPFRETAWRVDHELSDSTLSVSSKWKMNLDQLDLGFCRPFYQGERLTVSPFGGLRGLWIRQNYNVTFDLDKYKAQSHSWAVGPMAGALTHWLLDCGFRLEGKAGASLLYTRYLSVSHSETKSGKSTPSKIRDWDFLRPTANLGAGIGWGTYTGCRDYYLDLSARYDCHVLWDQNVMLQFVNAMNGLSGTSGNLYMHGLTLNMRVDF